MRKRSTRTLSRVATQRARVAHLLTHTVAAVHVRASLERTLRSGKRLRVKFGADPTSRDLHLGHAVILEKLRAFQDLGHTVVLIIGDATARVGDPSGRSNVRPSLAPRAIAANARTYVRQATRILEKKHLEIRFNSEWFDRMGFADLLALAAQFTVARLLEREDFATRLREQQEFHLHELLYPVLQAFDSVAVRADVEVGGTDQLFNLLAGRDLQRKLGETPQDVLTLPLLVGTDGTEKMSKSLGNAIGITEKPTEMFAKLMRLPDGAIPMYAELAAQWEDVDLKTLSRRLSSNENPRDTKADVAHAIVRRFHTPHAAERARAEWLRVVHARELPQTLPTVKLRPGAWDLVDLLVSTNLAASKSEARRLIAQGGVRVDGVVQTTPTAPVRVRVGTLLQVGKRRFVRVG